MQNYSVKVKWGLVAGVIALGQDDEHIPHHGDQVHDDEDGEKGFLHPGIGRETQQDEVWGAAAAAMVVHVSGSG